MKKAFLFLLVFLAVWDAGWALVGVKPLFPWQLEEEYRRGNPDLVLLDVRSSAEFNWLHLAGAYHVPLHRLSAANLEVSPKKTVVVICLTGHRSSLAAWRLQKHGYQNVYNLTWGLAGWEAYKFITNLQVQPEEAAPAKQRAGFPILMSFMLSEA
ncbi:MAG: rhodanese-like domain-containing protein [Deltaproteobacteria bacterium]|nr:rhodanese-like domain-containing protein [Deltaproteobacteria bacterium]